MTMRSKAFIDLPGWYHHTRFDVVADVVAYQRKIGTQIAAAEIGVYKGRFLVNAANLLLPPGGKVLAVDSFALEPRQTFVDSFKAHVTKALDLRILEGDSLLYSATDYQRHNPLGWPIFSVDGCHDFAHALHDVRCAWKSLSEGGVLLLDDTFNNNWPAVSAALFQFLTEQEDCRIICVCWGMTILASQSHADELRKCITATPLRTEVMFGDSIAIYGAWNVNGS